MPTSLAEQECVPCKGGVPPLKGDELAAIYKQLDPGWDVVEEHHLQKMFSFDTYKEGVDFTVKVAEIAEKQNHHPDILLTWCKVQVTVWTHKIDGLSNSDFIFAAKVDTIER